MSLITPWGYTISDSDSLDSILTVDEFNALTADKYASDERVESNLAAVSMAIRNYCGWHVFPQCECVYTATLWDGHLTRRGSSLIVQLPTRYLSVLEEVSIDGVTQTLSSAVQPNGLVKLYGVYGYSINEYTPFEFTYTAGVPDDFMGAVKELAAHRVVHALASSGGVQSETAGGVSITYSANWINNSRSTALADDNKEVLAPYKLQGVF